MDVLLNRVSVHVDIYKKKKLVCVIKKKEKKLFEDPFVR